MLYDKEDRMKRPEFLREFGFKETTEKKARLEGLPWPPYLVMGGGSIFYSRQLVQRWLAEHGGAPAEAPIGDAWLGDQPVSAGVDG
jgi:hypothetical protein